MRKTALISLLVPVLLVTVGCSIEPPLHMRKTAQTQVVMQTNINTDVMWQANWQSEWDFAWNAAAHGPVGYSAPTGIRMQPTKMTTMPRHAAVEGASPSPAAIVTAAVSSTGSARPSG